jgi:chromosome segregation ATPase
MKHTTEEIIESLRAAAWENEKIMDIAADRLEELQKECDEARAEVERLNKQLEQAIAERTPHDYGLLKHEVECLKQTVHDARIENSGQAAELDRLKEEYRVAHLERQHYKRIADHRQEQLCALVSRPDPCRLEIAAMFYAGREDFDIDTAIEAADALIAAAKEGR